MRRRKRSLAQKLAGWSILGAAGLVIVAIFLVTRLIGTPNPASPTVAEVSPSQATSSAAAPAPGPAATPPASAASAAPPSPTVALIDPSAVDQETRKAFILRLIRQGVFTGVQALDKPPKVGVTDVFQGLSLDLKQQFIATVDSYINNGAAGTETLQLIDAATGKQVGTYSAAEGLKLL